jgi:hypothetical protein
MSKINIDVIGTIEIEKIYKDYLYTQEVPEEEIPEILKKLDVGVLLFTLSSKTITDSRTYKDVYWCSIAAGDDLEYQFSKYPRE